MIARQDHAKMGVHVLMVIICSLATVLRDTLEMTAVQQITVLMIHATVKVLAQTEVAHLFVPVFPDIKVPVPVTGNPVQEDVQVT